MENIRAKSTAALKMPVNSVLRKEHVLATQAMMALNPTISGSDAVTLEKTNHFWPAAFENVNL